MKFSPGCRIVHAFAAFTTVCTFLLLISGGLVTSHGAGLAVPDWPNSYGYNMFLFPVSRWVGGIFYEHTHRLIASGIGFLTLILCAGIFKFDTRRWVKGLGVIAVIAVILQGVLGGLRVTMLKDEIGIFHGMLAQSFFVLLGVITVVTSRAFIEGTWAPASASPGLRNLAFVLVGTTFLQLGIAATMRHAHSGLSIRDFPLAYGKVIPDTSATAIEEINAARLAENEMPTTASLIWLQLAHRAVAVCIVILTLALMVACVRQDLIPSAVRNTGVLLSTLILLQIGLGAWTIWSNKAADITTAHHALGALFLFVAARLAFRLAVMNKVCERSRTPAQPELVSA